MKHKLKEVLNTLDLDVLRRASRMESVACPFTDLYGGPKKVSSRMESRACTYLCDMLYEEFRKNRDSCPCFYLSKWKVARIFWDALTEAKEVFC